MDETTTHDEVDLLVVGGGLGGLAAATLAARRGLRVLLVEAHALGGRARSTDVTAPGLTEPFRFNQGPHAVYEAGELAGLLTEVGVDPAGGSPGSLWMWAEGKAHLLPVSTGTLLRTTGLDRRSKAALARLFARVPRMRAERLAGTSLADWLDAQRLPPAARALALLHVRTSTYAHAPELLDAGAAVRQLQLAGRGVRYVHDGWQGLVDRLTAVARAAGADVRTDVGRIGLLSERSGWTVTTTDGTNWRAPSVVVATGSPRAAATLLGVDEARLGEPGPAVRAACLDLGLARAPEPATLFSAEGPHYLSTHMPPARLGPPGTVHVSVARYLAPGEHLRPEEARAELWAHAARAGITEDSPDLLAHRYLHEMAVSHGLPLAARGGLAGRPPVAVSGLEGAYLVGDWVGPVGMLSDAVAASAHQAVDAAAARAGALPARPVARA